VKLIEADVSKVYTTEICPNFDPKAEIDGWSVKASESGRQSKLISVL